MFDLSNLQRLTVSFVGAIMLSAVCVSAAIGPANAAAPSASASCAVRY